MKSLRFLLVLLCAVLAALAAAPKDNNPPVRVWEEDMSLPTYQWGDPDPNPLFYEGRTYQGAKGPIYPYPIIDQLTDRKVNRSYKAVWLENQYVKFCVLPELGGRIFAAVDKTNGYDFFYRQHVIKPALIGMLGAWISGGVEWNIPHHHRASSFQSVQYKTDDAPDGTKTVWVGELEIRHRMRWAVGLALRPDRSYIEVTVRLINRTPVVHSFLYFANVAVHTNPNYQVIFPSSTDVATQHSKVEFSRWPISKQFYGGNDFTRGVNVSQWKNHPRSISMFAHNSKEDFLAGYDHGQQKGTLLIGDHGVVTGKKFFTWGVGSSWDNMLTDEDGPYLELMVGGYSDNQPDYSWIQPYEVKTVKQYWYPYDRLGGVKNANTEAAVNLEVETSGAAKVGFYTTGAHAAAKVSLSAGGKSILSETIQIAPGKPFLRDVSLPAGVKEEDLLAKIEVDGKELVSYRPVKSAETPLPDPIERPKPPKEVATNEELYLTGLRLEQFYNPALEPDPYYEEAIRRDPNDVKANTALGILYYRRARLEEAEQRLRTAAGRATKNFTNPKDGEALYYLGLVLKAQGKYEEAYEWLYRATWSYGYHTAGFMELAEIAGLRQDPARSVEFLDRAIATNAWNTKALLLKAAMLRQLGRKDEALELAKQALNVDPLDRWAMRELKGGGQDPPPSIANNLDYNVNLVLETAVDYGNAGLYKEAVAVLNDLASAWAQKGNVYPMVWYYLAHYSGKLGDDAKASEYYRLAMAAPADFCFPFRLESIGVLREAMARNPRDARAPYYLGNLLFDWQPEAAVREWEKARDLDPKFTLVHRNLAWAYARVEQKPEKAIASLEQAISTKPEARYLYELDRLYESTGADPEKRLAMLERNHNVALLRDDALDREIRLLVLLGKYDRALELLSDRQFHSWEGGGRFSVHDSYVDAHIMRGSQLYKAGKHKEAAKEFEAALVFPKKLSAVEFSGGDRAPQVHYLAGMAYKALGDEAAAKKHFEQSLAREIQTRRRRGGSALDTAQVLFFQARALEQLGRKQEAADLYNRLVTMGQDGLSGGTATTDIFAKFGERQSRNAQLAQAHYALGLGYLGSGKSAEAKAEFEQALKLNVNHLAAKAEAQGLGI